MSDDPWIECVKPRYWEVVEALNPEDLHDHLISGSLLSFEQGEILNRESRMSTSAGARYLLNVLRRILPKKKTFNTFCSILEKLPSQKGILQLFVPADHVLRKCQECTRFDSEEVANVFCTGSGCINSYYCFDCWENVHERRSLTQHVYRELSVFFELRERSSMLNVRDTEFLMTVPKLSLPWKKVAPGLFQLLKVSLGDSEKVLVAEAELSHFCNTFFPQSSSPDCSLIDFDTLLAIRVTSIGLAGDSRAIFDFLQNHLHVSSKISYQQMADSKVCPTGLYALMVNKACLFLFYWRSSFSLEFHNRSIPCQMLKRIRDLCSEIILCFDKPSFLNLKLPRPEKKSHQFTRDAKLSEEQRCVQACEGLFITFEATTERVFVCDSKQQLCLYTPHCREKAWTGKSTFDGHSEDLLREFNNFQDYRIIWKAERSPNKVVNFAASSSLRAFLRVAFPNTERALQLIDADEKEARRQCDLSDRILKECQEEQQLLERCWKEKICSFLGDSFSLEETADPFSLEAIFNDESKEYQLCRDRSEERFFEKKDQIRKDFEQLRQKTLELQNILSETSGSLEREAAEKFYNFDLTASEALRQFRSNSSLLTWIKTFLRKVNFDVHKDFTLPKKEPLLGYHLLFYRDRRNFWLSLCPFRSLYVIERLDEKRKKALPFLKARIDELYKRRKDLVDEVFSSGRLAFEVLDYTSLVDQNKVHLFYNREYYKIKYRLRKLEAVNNELMETKRNCIFSDVHETEFNMHMAKDELEVRALYCVPSCSKNLLIAFSKSFGKVSKQCPQATGNYTLAERVAVLFGKLDNSDNSDVLLNLYQKGISLVVYDADKRLLGFWNKDEKLLSFYKFTETFSRLFFHSRYSLKDGSIEVDIVHMKFISESNRILLVDCNLRGLVFDIRSKKFYNIDGRSCLRKKEESLMAVFTYKDFVLTVSCPSSRTSDSRGNVTYARKTTKCNCDVRAYSLKGFCLVPEALHHSFVGVSQNSQFRLLELQNQLHLVCIDSSAGICQSALLNLFSPAFKTDEVDVETNEILEDFYTVFRNYPVTNCYETETKPLQITFVIPSDLQPSISSEDVYGSMQLYFRSMFEALRVETGKSVKSLIRRMRLQVCFSDDLSRVFSYPYDPMTVEKFVLSLSTSVPIQIAKAANDALIPLSKGVALLEASNSVAEIVDSISLGFHEAIFRHAKKPTKVISSTGRRRIGKSFLLNHVTGAQFDVSDNRSTDSTQGVWISIGLYPEVTIVSLDFEGSSFERSRIEDLLMLHFASAISSVTVLMTGPRLDMETKQILSCFQDEGVCLRQCDLERKHVFKGRLHVACRDVSGRDSELVQKEMLADIKGEESNIIDLFGGHFRTIGLENFGKPELFEGFDQIREFLDEQEECFGSAENTLYLIKKVLAKLVKKDWSSLDN